MSRFQQYEELARRLKSKLSYSLKKIKREPNGVLRHAYLVPGGPYEEQWDWDAFFMGVALLSEKRSEGVFLKNWCLNYLENSAEDGKVPGCLSPEGADPRLHQMKPFLSQGAFLASKALKDYSWVEEHYAGLERVLGYRERELWSDDYKLALWFDSMESGADNNVAALDFEDKTVAAADVNAFMYREYEAMRLIAEKLGKSESASLYSEKAKQLHEQVQKLLWSSDDTIYYNLNIRSGDHIRRVTYSCFVPIWAKMATEEQAHATLQKYLLSPEHCFAKAGIRTLSKQDEQYNNENIIKPHSNWQGPVWPIASYIFAHALSNYGFQGEALESIRRVANCVVEDIDRSGGMHENYDAETCEPLAAPDFVSWNILLRGVIPELVDNKNPFALEY